MLRRLPVPFQWRRIGSTPSSCIRLLSNLSSKAFHTSATSLTKPLPPRPKINEADIEEAFLKGSGPGGQKINKTSSAVQLHHNPTGIVVKSQATRSRSQNRKIARQLLAEKLEVLEKGDESRVVIKAKIKSKKKASGAKKRRRKYRLLGQAEEADEEDENDIVEDKPKSDQTEGGGKVVAGVEGGMG